MMNEPRSVKELLEVGERVLDDSTHLFDEHDHRYEAEQLLAHVLSVEPSELDDVNVPSRPQRDRFLALIARRSSGEPLPFLTGYIEFYGMHMKVARGAFVPRPSSELTVDRGIHHLKRTKDPVVVDVCAGAAPIALAIAHNRPDAEVWALDISREALAAGRRNARAFDIHNLSIRVSDMYAALPSRLEGSVNLITAHVPYVPLDEIDALPTEVREHEPVYTLTDHSDDGLELMRRAVFEAGKWLAPGGWLLLEMSDDITTKVQKMVRKAGLEDAGVASDDDDLSVVVEARKPRISRGSRGGSR